MKRLGAWVLARWCRWFHGRPMHPISGRYRCSKCLCEFPVQWEVPATKRWKDGLAQILPGNQVQL